MAVAILYLSIGGAVAEQIQPRVVIYTHADCAYSAAAKVDYQKRQVDFVEIELSKQPDKIPELLKLTNGERITPVIVEDGQTTIGFKGGY